MSKLIHQVVTHFTQQNYQVKTLSLSTSRHALYHVFITAWEDIAWQHHTHKTPPYGVYITQQHSGNPGGSNLYATLASPRHRCQAKPWARWSGSAALLSGNDALWVSSQTRWVSTSIIHIILFNLICQESLLRDPLKTRRMEEFTCNHTQATCPSSFLQMLRRRRLVVRAPVEAGSKWQNESAH